MITDAARAAQLADLRNWAPDTAKAVEDMPDETIASAWADEEKRFRERMMEKTAGQVLFEELNPDRGEGTILRTWEDSTSIPERAAYERFASVVIAHYEATRWISVDDALPNDGETVGFVTHCPNDKFYHGRILGGRFTAGEFGGFSVPGLMVQASHWFRFPAPPKEAPHA